MKNTKKILHIAVVGSRNFDNYELLSDALDFYVNKADTIISGGAKGADTFAEVWASKNSVNCTVYKPDYKRYGRYKAPHIRNQKIVDDSDIIIAFWDYKSKGTKSTIDKARAAGKKVIIINTTVTTVMPKKTQKNKTITVRAIKQAEWCFIFGMFDNFIGEKVGGNVYIVNPSYIGHFKPEMDEDDFWKAVKKYGRICSSFTAIDKDGSRIIGLSYDSKENKILKTVRTEAGLIKLPFDGLQ